MSDYEDYVWRLTMPKDGGPLALEAGEVLRSMDPKEYIVHIGEALINIGTRFLLSSINNGVYDLEAQDNQTPEIDPTDTDEYTFE